MHAPRPPARLTRLTACIALAMIASATLTPTVALAQQLNLSPRYSPKPNDGIAAPALARRLSSRARELEAPPGIDPHTQPHRAILHDLFTLAHDLLIRGESLGTEGSMLILAGQSLADDLPALEAWITPDRFPDAIGIATDLRAAADNDVEKLPADPVALYRIFRDRLSPLVPETVVAHSPWWLRPQRATTEPAAQTFAALAEHLSLSDDARAKAAALDALVSEGGAHPSFVSSAANLQRSLNDAAPLLLAPPAWLARSVEPLKRELASALNELSTPADTTTGQLRLRRLALLSRAITRSGTLRDSGPTRKLTDALTRTIGSLPTSVSASELARLRALTDALESTDVPPVLRADLDRNLRPALPSLTSAVEEGRATLIAALPRLLDPDATTTEPAIISARASLRRRIADVEMLSDLSPAIAAPDAPATPGKRTDPMVPIRARVLKLSQDLVKPSLHDVALAELRDLATGLAPTVASPRLRELFDDQATGSLTHKILGDRRTTIVELAKLAREAWITQTAASLATRRPPEPFAADLAAAAEVYLQARASTDPRALALLNRWPAFRLSTTQAQKLGAPLREPLAACDAALDAKRIDQFVAAVNQLRRQGDSLWIGLLALAAPDDAEATTPADQLPRSLAELALGGPDPEAAWQIDHADQIALVCRYLEELAASESRKDRARDLGNYLSTRARALFTTLQASDP